jgi:2'-5' RNA ligase superfamily
VSRLALVVPFEGLAPVVDDLRERTCESKPSHGMPPHVTLLVPAPRDVEGIAEVFFAFAAFEVVLPRLERFPGTLWLAPEPALPFASMIEALWQRFPDYPPYGGAFKEAVPHLTVAQSEFDEAIATLEPWLPLSTRADRAVLLERMQAPHWREVATFELEDA